MLRYAANILLLAFVLLSGYLLYHIFFQKRVGLLHLQSQTNVIIYGVRTRSYNELGTLSNILVSPQISYNIKQDKSRIEQPNIIFWQGEKQPWHVSAGYALASTRQNHVEFYENVVLHQPEGRNNHEVKINTSYLNVNNKTHIAKTNKAIQMREWQKHKLLSAVNAVGAVMNQVTGEIELLSHAQGIYIPNG